MRKPETLASWSFNLDRYFFGEFAFKIQLDMAQQVWALGFQSCMVWIGVWSI